MLKVDKEKDAENILREEMLQERAAVLGRAGEKLNIALEKMTMIEHRIEDQLQHFSYLQKKCRDARNSGEFVSLRRKIVQEINGEIGQYNHAREYAKLRYYYLIVTREAMGMRRHHWVEEIYKIPPRKKYLRDV
ncbi:MAG TPA: hypothetical protein DDY17_11510 [Syntrophaceae bacterium]|jgi:hypothetical protein|nr:hypothetical protein [Syntrophaceae bacterium]